MTYRRLLAFALTGCALLAVGPTWKPLARAAEAEDEKQPFNFEEASRKDH